MGSYHWPPAQAPISIDTARDEEATSGDRAMRRRQRMRRRSTMRRRTLLKMATGAAILGAPHLARAERDRTLKFVPFLQLALLDPIWATARATHLLAYAVFDTLYGIDDAYAVHPQMAEGHEV